MSLPMAAGRFRSVFRGSGMEFEEVREYSPGDEIRDIDWKVSARLGKPFVKKYREERELLVMLLVDMSASKRFGTTENRKIDTAAEIAAILALAATSNNDRVGLLLVTDRVEHFVPPDTGRRHALRLVLELLAHRPEGRGTRLSEGLRFAEKVLRQRSTVFLISDFLTGEAADPQRLPGHHCGGRRKGRVPAAATHDVPAVGHTGILY